MALSRDNKHPRQRTLHVIGNEIEGNGKYVFTVADDDDLDESHINFFRLGIDGLREEIYRAMPFNAKPMSIRAVERAIQANRHPHVEKLPESRSMCKRIGKILEDDEAFTQRKARWVRTAELPDPNNSSDF